MDINYQPYQGNVKHSNSYLTLIPSAPLNHWIQTFWQLNVPDGHYEYRSIPDNCVDLIVNLDNPGDMFIITPFSSSIVFTMTGPISYFGIRFRILGHQGLISAPLGQWNNPRHQIHASEILPQNIFSEIYDGIALQTDFESLCSYISNILIGTLKPGKIDKRLQHYILYCQHNISSSIPLTDNHCSKFGISARQLRRLTHNHLGLAPKEFASVLRFQHTLKIMNTLAHTPEWSRHYYDQSHFNREFKSMSGMTPSEFVNLSVLYNPGKE